MFILFSFFVEENKIHVITMLNISPINAIKNMLPKSISLGLKNLITDSYIIPTAISIRTIPFRKATTTSSLKNP